MKMYQRFLFPGYRVSIFSFVLVLGIILFSVSCRKTTALAAPTGTAYIMEQLDTGANYSLFASLIKKAGMDGLLNDPGNYSIFVPDNAAFQAAGLGQHSIDSLSGLQASFMVRYLIVPNFNLDTLQYISYNQSRYPVGEFLNMDSICLGITDQGGAMYFNGQTAFTTKGITAANGILYPIHFFPQIPTQTILQKLKALHLNFLVAAINHSDLLPLFATSQDSVTLMAPTDQAFINAGFPDTLSLINNGPDMLDSLLEAHIIMLKFYSQDYNGYAGYIDYDPASYIDNVIPATEKLKWIVPGLVHNGHSPDWGYLINGSWEIGRDMYRFTLLAANNGNGKGDLGYVSDGSHYSFYRNLFYNADSSTVANVISPNVTAINGLIHVVDHVLPYQNVNN